MRIRAGSNYFGVMMLAALAVGLWLAALSASVPPRSDLAQPFHPILPSSAPLLSDLDGDRQLDRTELFSGGTHKSIQVSLSSSWTSHLSFDSKTADRGRLLSEDIDQDSDLDLVWVSQADPSTFVIWLGDGRGNFEIVRNPEAYARPLGSRLDSEAEASLAGATGREELACDASPSGSFEPPPAPQLGGEVSASRPPRSAEKRRGLALSLAFLRERGPPPHLSS